MKKTSYKVKSDKELTSALYEQRQILSKFRFSIAGSKTRDVKAGRAAKIEIARIMTELNSKK